MEIKVSFYGRQNGAIGVRYNITDTYIVESVSEFKSKLWEDYEPNQITMLKGCSLDEYKKADFIKVRSRSLRQRKEDGSTYVTPEKLICNEKESDK